MRRLSALAAALLLAGCGLTSSPADGLAFTAPAGWQASPGIMGFAQFWKPESDSDEVLMLFRSPRQLDREQIFSNGKIEDAQIEQQHEITICGNQRALYLKGQAKSSVDNHPSKPHNIELTTTNANGATYFAMYVYPLGHAPNAQAEGALRELCVKH
jgi:hypothetical protein